MSELRNGIGQPIGFIMPDWVSREPPPRTSMEGRFCRVEPLDVARHAEDLYRANSADTEDSVWTYLLHGPFCDFAAYRHWMENTCLGDDPLFFAVIDLKTSNAVGVASYMRIDPANGVIEVGHINYSPALQRTAAGTEAMYLMMKRAFDEFGYRRYEWKCDKLNVASMRAAQRYGFTFEGVFRQALVTKGRNRDTAWFAIIDQDWPAIKIAFESWLSPDNMDDEGQQKQSFGTFMPTMQT